MSTNFPIVKFDNGGSVWYGKVTGWTPSVATGATSTVYFTLPPDLPAMGYDVTVVASGVESSSVSFSYGGPFTVDTSFNSSTPGFMMTTFNTVTDAINAASGGQVIIVDGSNGRTGSGVYGEDVHVDKPVTLYLQGGPVSFNSLSGNDSGATIVLLGVDLTTDADSFNHPLDATLQGTGGLDKDGTQTLTLNADGSGYSGTVTINGGEIQLGNSNALADSTVDVEANNGLNFGVLTAATLGALAGTAGINLGSTNLTVGGNDADTTYSGDFTAGSSSPGSITKVGVSNNLGAGVFSGVWTLSGNNQNYAGPVAIDAGTVEVGSANALFGSTVNVIAGLGNGLTSVTANGGTLAATTLGGLTGSGNVNMGTTNLTVGQDGDTTTFSGTLSGSGTFNKVGLGKLTLTATNGGAAGTTISSGILAVPSDGDLPGGTVTINVSSAVLSELEYTGTSSTSRSFVLDGGTIVVDAGQTLTVGSSITGDSIHKGYLQGPGTFASPTSGLLGGPIYTYIIARPSATINSRTADVQFVHFDNSATIYLNSGSNTTFMTTTFNDFKNEGRGHNHDRPAVRSRLARPCRGYLRRGRGFSQLWGVESLGRHYQSTYHIQKRSHSRVAPRNFTRTPRPQRRQPDIHRND